MKKIRILLIAVLLIIAGAFFNNTYAATRSLKAIKARNGNEYRYYVTGKNGTDVYYSVVKIYDTNDNTKSIYCLRGNRGFGTSSDSSDISESAVKYTENSDMHSKARNVINRYNNLYGVNLDKIEAIADREGNEVKVNIYNAILWILDESYLPNDNGEYKKTEYREELLDKAGVPKTQQGDITDDDIEVIQQLAIWYFTNYDEQGNNPTVSQTSLYPANLIKLNDDTTKIPGSNRRNNLNKLYQYFIFGAIDNFSIYRRK